MKHIFFISAILLHNLILLGQDTGAISFPEHCHHLATNSYQCKWDFIVLDKPIQGYVIDYVKMPRRCGIEWTASVCILRTENDTIRVILQCFQKELKKGQKVIITQVKEPDTDVGVPMDSEFFQNTSKNGKPIWRINKYDALISKTVFGHVIKS